MSTDKVQEEESAQEISLEDQVKKLETQIKAEQDKAESILNKMKYLQADFDNYRKRVDKELAETKQFVNEKLITNLLDVVDEFELALKVAREGGKPDSLAGGVEMTLRKLLDILGKEGLARIEAIGKKFDPNLHEATEIVPAKDEDEGLIVAEIRPGYMLKGKVLRPSMVKVTAATV